MTTPTHHLAVISPRIAAGAGFLAAGVLAINVLKRAGALPVTDLTQLIAPLGQALAIVFVVGLAAAAPRRGPALAVATTLNVLALALLVGVEFVINLIFRDVDPALVQQLQESALGTAFVVASVGFLIASWAYAVVLARHGSIPRGALALYAVSATPVALRAFLPEGALLAGLVGLAAAIVWLAVWLLAPGRDAVAGTPQTA